MVTYSESGVDINLEEKTILALTKNLKDTFNFVKFIGKHGHFASVIEVDKKKIAMTTDGVGSKIIVANMMKKYDTIGIDCVAMIVNDLLCVGAKPVAMVDYLAFEKPDPKIAEEIGKGLAKGAKMSNIGIIGGETASLPDIINGFDLAGTGIGIIENEIIDGSRIEVGDVVIGMKSNGIHSNGLSLARKVFFEEESLNVDDPLPGFPDVKIGNELLKPTRIYVKPILKLLKSDVEIHGLVHITGGGFKNLERLNEDVGYYLDNLPEPQPIFKSIYKLGVPLDEMYKVFNMGVGFIVIVKKKDASKALNILNNYIDTSIIGKVTEDKILRIKTFKDKIISI